MIFRAICGIGLVLLLMPHKPGAGLGRPGAGISLPAMTQFRGVTGLSRPGSPCGGLSSACAGGLGALAGARTGVRTLADVKAEIDASIEARRALAGI